MCTILCVPFGVLSWFKNKKNVPFLYNLPHFKPHNKQKRQPLRTAPVKPLFRRFLGLLEVSVQQTLESLSVSCLVLCHFVNEVERWLITLALIAFFEVVLICTIDVHPEMKNTLLCTILVQCIGVLFMSGNSNNGVFQNAKGQWGYRFSLLIDGKRITRRKFTDENGIKLTSIRAAE